MQSNTAWGTCGTGLFIKDVLFKDWYLAEGNTQGYNHLFNLTDHYADATYVIGNLTNRIADKMDFSSWIW